MTSNQRNFAVGATVLAAVVIFLWMILRFGTKTVSLFAPQTTTVEIDAPRVDGLSEGSPLTYQGVVVGRVLKLQRDPSGTGVHITAQLAADPPVPVNVNAEIVTTDLIGGGATIALNLPTDEKTGIAQKPKILPKDSVFPAIHAGYIGLQLNILPSEYGSTAEQITRAAKAIADASEEVRERSLVAHVDDAVQNVSAQATRAGQVLQNIDDLIADPSVKSDLRETIANSRKASEKLAEASATLPELSKQASATMTDSQAAIVHLQQRVDEISKQLGDGLTKTSALLASIQTLSDRIDKGQGTAGLLINDPKLYQSLVDDSRELNATLKDLQRLVEQWEQEGVSFKL
jgi:phospholipid/cholesterol/gamma-HCH transport system substrate-binding protein